MDRFYKYILCGIVLLGFALRLKVCAGLLHVDPNVLNPSHLTDMATYKTLALQIAQGKYWSPFYYQPFYYAVFLAGIFKALGTNVYYLLISQSLLGALTILFAALSAEILWDKKTAIVAALLVMLSQTLNFYTAFMLIVTLQAFWISLLLYFTLLAFKQKKNVYWIHIGFVTACSILTRANIWAFVPILIIASIIFGINNRKNERNLIRRHIIPFTYFLFFMILPQIPFFYLNTEISHKFSEPGTVASVALSYGNTPESPPAANSSEFGAGVVEMNPTQQYWLANTDKVSVPKRILDFIKEKPFSYLELTFRKLLLFWDYREIPNNVDINRELTPLLKYICFITTGILMLLAIPGVLIFLPFSSNKWKYLIPLSFLLAYWASISLVKILARYRAPIIPIMAIYAASFICFFINKKINIRKLLIALLLVIFAIFIVFLSYDSYRYNLEAKVINLVNPKGVAIDMGDKTMYIDNGPMLFGSWKTMLLHQGNTLKKTFITPPSHGNCTLRIPFVAKSPVQATININDKIFSFKLNDPGKIKDFIIPAKYIDGKSVINMKLNELSGELYCIMDYQRNFGRSKINNKSISAELVCRLFYPKPPS